MPAANSRLRPQVILLGLAALLNDTASEMIYPLLPIFLTVTLGATPVVIGMIEGAADGLSSILKYYAGAWSDRRKTRKPLIVGGYMLAAASRVMIAMATMWPAVLTARLVDRTGKGIRSAPRDAMIADVTPPEQRGRAFGFHRALDHTGAIIGPLIAMLLLGAMHVEVRTLFFIAVIPGIAGALLLAFALKEVPHDPAAARVDDVAAKLPRPFWNAVAGIALFSLANSSDAFLLLQAHAAGVSTAMLPLLWALHHVIKSLFSTQAGALSDRMPRKWLLAIGWTIYAIIYAIFPLADSLVSFVTLFIVYAIPFTLTEGAERAWVASFAPAEARGRVFGIYYLANGLCVLAGSALFGVLYQSVSPASAFYAGAGLALCAAIVAAAHSERAIPAA